MVFLPLQVPWGYRWGSMALRLGFCSLLITAGAGTTIAETVTSGAGVLGQDIGCNIISDFIDPIRLSVAGLGAGCSADGVLGVDSTSGLGPISTTRTFTATTFNINNGTPNGTVTGTGFGSASAGSLGASAMQTIDCPNPGCQEADAFGFAIFTDLVTILPGSDTHLLGTQGEFHLVFDVTGSIVKPGGPQPPTLVEFGAGTNQGCEFAGSAFSCNQRVDNYYGGGNPIIYAQDHQVASGGVYLSNFIYNFTYGEPFDFTLILGVNTSLSNGHFSSSIDFADTMRISGIQMLDQFGNPVSGWTATSASGLQYGPDGISQTSTPEPSTFPLIGGGLLTVSYLLRRATRRGELATHRTSGSHFLHEPLRR